MTLNSTSLALSKTDNLLTCWKAICIFFLNPRVHLLPFSSNVFFLRKTPSQKQNKNLMAMELDEINGLALLLATKPVWVLKTSYLYVRKDFLFVLRKYCTGIQCILVIDTPHFLQLPIRAWVRAYPLEHGEPTSGLSTKKSDSLSSSQLPVGRQLEVGLQEFFPHPYWSF